MARKRGAPEKPKEQQKAALAQIRLLATEKEGFEEAAKMSGLSLSAWMRERLRTVARRELEAHGRTAPFLKK